MIRGIRLGMTISEIRALYPDASEPSERDEVGRSAIFLQEKEDGSRLEGISSIFLHLFSGRVYSIRASYDESHLKEANELIKPLDLPDKSYANTECQGFSAGVFRHSDKTLTIEVNDSKAFAKIIKLTNEIEENSADCQKTPVIRRIVLGMPEAQFRSLYPHARSFRQRIDVGELVLHIMNYRDPSLNGISDVWGFFLDGKLYFFLIDYSSQVQWKDIDQFVENFSKPMGLRMKWEGSTFTESRSLRCHSFIVKAEMKDGHPRVMIQDRAAALLLNKREEQLKSPSSFRP